MLLQPLASQLAVPLVGPELEIPFLYNLTIQQRQIRFQRLLKISKNLKNYFTNYCSNYG